MQHDVSCLNFTSAMIWHGWHMVAETCTVVHTGVLFKGCPYRADIGVIGLACVYKMFAMINGCDDCSYVLLFLLLDSGPS